MRFKLNKRSGILYAVALLVVLGLLLAILLPDRTWTRVLSFFSGFILPAIGGAAALIGTNVAIDKFRRPAASGDIPGHYRKPRAAP